MAKKKPMPIPKDIAGMKLKGGIRKATFKPASTEGKKASRKKA